MNDIADQSIIVMKPDVNSAEAILYGKEYLQQKSADWFWDAVEDELRRELEDNKRKIRDVEFAAMVLKNRPNMIFARNPPVSNVNQLKDLQIMKLCVKNGTALRDLEIRRKNNELYSRMKGIAQYTEKMMEEGISDRTWRVSTNGKNEPITYDTIRRLLDNDELKAEADAREFAIELDAYNADRTKFAEELDEYKRAHGSQELDHPDIDSEEDSGFVDEKIPDIPIYMEVGESRMLDPNSDEFWDDEDVEEYYQDADYEPELISRDFLNGPLHNAIQIKLACWYADDVEWFLTEVVG